MPDEYTVADDVVIEASHGDTEIAFTRADIDDAEHLGEGVYRLKSGAPAALPDERDASTERRDIAGAQSS